MEEPYSQMKDDFICLGREVPIHSACSQALRLPDTGGSFSNNERESLDHYVRSH